MVGVAAAVAAWSREILMATLLKGSSDCQESVGRGFWKIPLQEYRR
jgi:hypothetical protein